MDRNYLKETSLLDFSSGSIQELMTSRAWFDLNSFERVGAAYDFVRDEIVFGYNSSDNITASAVLADGYGQCNTKGTLLMALLRGLGIPAVCMASRSIKTSNVVSCRNLPMHLRLTAFYTAGLKSGTMGDGSTSRASFWIALFCRLCKIGSGAMVKAFADMALEQTACPLRKSTGLAKTPTYNAPE